MYISYSIALTFENKTKHSMQYKRIQKLFVSINDAMIYIHVYEGMYVSYTVTNQPSTTNG